MHTAYFMPSCAATLACSRAQARHRILYRPVMGNSATAERRYSPAWRSLEPTVGQTAEVLEASVQQVCPDAQLVEWASMPNGEYRAFTVGSLFGRDRHGCACVSLRAMLCRRSLPPVPSGVPCDTCVLCSSPY